MASGLAQDHQLSPAWIATRPRPNDNELGPIIRMHPILASQLPAHPDLDTSSDERLDLTTFVRAALNEAHAFATTFMSKFRVKAEDKDASPSIAKVKQLSNEVDTMLPAADGKSSRPFTETWYARVSQHENAVKDGTASWEEFDAGLRDNHAQHEMEYTPDLKDANLVLDWQSELSGLQDSFGEWREVSAEIREMVHQLPPPLSKRCFSVMVIAARKDDEFINMQLPLELHGVSKAKYVGAPGITVGIYVSVEYGKLIDGGQKVEWRMATSSDAKGNLPMWAQKLGVPGAIVKDVSLFMDWRMKERSKGS